MSALIEAARELDLAESSLAQRSVKAGARHLATAWQVLALPAEPTEESLLLARRYVDVALKMFVPALIELAGTTPNDAARWSWLRVAESALRAISDWNKALYVTNRCTRQDFEELCAEWGPVLEGVTLAIGAPYA